MNRRIARNVVSKMGRWLAGKNEGQFRECMRPVLMVLLLAIPVSSMACIGQSASLSKPQTMEKLKIVYAAPSAGYAPVWMAMELGLFEKYGLDAELAFISQGPVIVASLIAKEVQLAAISAPSPMNAYLEGGETVWIANAVNTPVFYLMSDPSIKDVRQLKGKSLGVTRFGSTTDAFARLALKKFDLDPGKDVTILQTGGAAASLGALSSGQVSAAVFAPPNNLTARNSGFSTLVDLSRLSLDYPFSGVVATKSYIKQNPDTIRKFTKAYVEGIYFLKRDAKKSKEVIGKYTENANEKELEETYQAFVDHYEMIPYPTVKAMIGAVNEMATGNPKAREIDLKEYFDDRFIKELDDSGFIKKLYEKK